MKNRGLYIYMWFLFVSVVLLALFVTASYIFLGLPLSIMIPSLLFCAGGLVLLIIPLQTLKAGVKAVTVSDLTDTQVFLLATGCILACLGLLSLLFFPRAGMFMKMLFLMGALYLLLKAVTLLFRLYKDKGDTF